MKKINLYDGLISVAEATGSTRVITEEFGLTSGRFLPTTDLSTSPLDTSNQSDVVRALLGAYRTQEELFKVYESVRGLDVVQIALDVALEDFFFGTDEDDFFKVEYKQQDSDRDGVLDDEEAEVPSVSTEASLIVKRINEELRDFVKRLGLVKFVRGLMEDLMLIGQYPFRIKSNEDEGITELLDDVDPVLTLAVYENSELAHFLERSGPRFLKRAPNVMGLISLGGSKIRVDIPDNNRGKKRIAQYARVGRSLIYNAIKEIKRLQVIKMAAVAKSLKSVLTPTIFAVGVPGNATPEEVSAAVKQYEKSLNSFAIGLRDGQDLSFAEVFQMTARIKLIPQFTDGKGQVQNLSLDDRNGDSDIDIKEQNLRADIALALGFPVHYFVRQSQDNQTDKLTLLKGHSRYTRKGQSIQDSIEEGLRDLIMLHFDTKKGLPKIDREDIKVHFKTLVNMEVLDRVEFSVACVQTLRDVHTTLAEIAASSEVKIKVSSIKFLKLCNFLLKPFGIEGLLEDASMDIPYEPTPTLDDPQDPDPQDPDPQDPDPQAPDPQDPDPQDPDPQAPDPQAPDKKVAPTPVKSNVRGK